MSDSGWMSHDRSPGSKALASSSFVIGSTSGVSSGSLGLTNHSAVPVSTSWASAHTLMVQANPTEVRSALRMSGNTTPPNPDPMKMTPVARPRLVSNHWPRYSTTGSSSTPLVTPNSTPWNTMSIATDLANDATRMHAELSTTLTSTSLRRRCGKVVTKPRRMSGIKC